MTNADIEIDPSKILKQGFMEKEGGSVRSWKKRWFVLCEKILHYYKDSNMKEAPLGSIPIVDCRISTEDTGDGSGYYFMLVLPQTSNARRNQFVIRVATSDDRAQWILAINKANIYTIFKFPLINALKVNPAKPGLYIPIPYFITKAFKHLEDNYLRVEGLYRLNGSLTQIENLVAQINKNQQIEFTDPNTTTGLVKLFMTSLPESLISIKYLDSFRDFGNITTDEQVSILRHTLRSIPLPNYLMLVYLFQHLRKVLDNVSENKMDERAISVCIGPSLIFTEESSLQFEVAKIQQAIASVLLTEYNRIFSSRPLMMYSSNSNITYNKVNAEQDSHCPFVLDVTPNTIVQTVVEDPTGWTISVYNDRWGVIHKNYLTPETNQADLAKSLAKQTNKWTLKQEELAMMGNQCPEAVQLYELLLERVKGLRERVGKKYS